MRGEFVPDRTRWSGNPIGPWREVTIADYHATSLMTAIQRAPRLPATRTSRSGERRLRRRLVRPRPRATGSAPTAWTAPRVITRDERPGAAFVQPRPGAAARVPGARRRQQAHPVHADAVEAARHAGTSRSARRDFHGRDRLRRFARPARSHWGTIGWEELDRRGASSPSQPSARRRGSPATTARRQAPLPHRASPPSRRTPCSRTACLFDHARLGRPRHLVVRADRSRWRPTSRRADRPLRHRDARRSPASRASHRVRARGRAPVRGRLRAARSG